MRHLDLCNSYIVKFICTSFLVQGYVTDSDAYVKIIVDHVKIGSTYHNYLRFVLLMDTVLCYIKMPLLLIENRCCRNY